MVITVMTFIKMFKHWLPRQVEDSRDEWLVSLRKLPELRAAIEPDVDENWPHEMEPLVIRTIGRGFCAR